MEWFDLVGVTGALLIVIAYFLLQTDNISNENPSFSIINALGALFILISLCFEFNFAAFFIEFFWLLISVYGVWKWIRLRSDLEKTN
jgi:hypothetical protein